MLGCLSGFCKCALTSKRRLDRHVVCCDFLYSTCGSTWAAPGLVVTFVQAFSLALCAVAAL